MATRQIAAETATSRVFHRWMASWWKEDFSVEGCDRKSIRPPRPYGAQIIEFAGRRWYGSHCPPFDLEGNVCEEFSSLPPVTAQGYLGRAFQDSTHKIDLRGAFIDDILMPPSGGAHLDVRGAHIMGKVLFRGQTRRVYMQADNSYVSDDIELSSAASAELDLMGGIVHGTINLAPNQSGRINLSNSTLFGNVTLAGTFDEVLMDKSVVRGALDASGLAKVKQFSAHAAKIHQKLTLRSGSAPTQAKLDLSAAQFRAGLDIGGISNPEGVDLSKSTVKGRLDIHNLTTPWVDLTGAKCGDLRVKNGSGSWTLNGGDFASVNLEDGTYRELTLEGATTKSSVIVEKCKIGKLVLASAIIEHKLTLRECVLTIGCHAKGLRVGSATNFTGTEFGLASSFRAAHFGDGADFSARSDRSDTNHPPVAELRAMDFRNASFDGRSGDSAANFSGRTFRGRADFQHAKFSGAAYFERDAFKEDVSFRLAQFSHPKQRIGSFARKAAFPFVQAVPIESRRHRSEVSHLYERSFSNLKDAMRASGSSRFEKRFYIYELRSRRGRSDGEVGASERAFSYAYDIFAEYGESISKPLAWLVASPFLFGLLYLILGSVLTFHGAWSALDFSLQQIFRPFYVWSTSISVDLSKEEYQTWVYLNLFDLDGSRWDPAGRAVFVKMLCVIESLIAVTLSFLLAVSVKRRFQVQ